MASAVDNDVIYKSICYGLALQLFLMIPSEIKDVGFLGSARFVVRGRLRRAPPTRGSAVALADFEALLKQTTTLEPTQEEVLLAAELELTAQRLGLNLDGGESQLCIMTARRGFSSIVTGDKRAIAALEVVLATLNKIAELAGKVICLEQLFLRLVAVSDPAPIRAAVCREAGVDRALSVCFGCYSPEMDKESCIEGLQSYIRHLRRDATTILAS